MVCGKGAWQNLPAVTGGSNLKPNTTAAFPATVGLPNQPDSCHSAQCAAAEAHALVGSVS
jgi:hypothetical protein